MSNANLLKVGRSYAQALLEVAQDQEMAEDLYAAILDRLAFFQSPACQKVLKSPLLTREDHSQIIPLFKAKKELQGILSNFISTLSFYSKMALLPAILKTYCELYIASIGAVEVTVITAHPLSAAQEKTLQKKLESHLQKTVFLDKKVQDDLIAGYLLEYNGQRLDLSLKSRFNQFATYGAFE